MNTPQDDDPALIEPAGRLFEMARTGDTATVAALLSRGADPAAGDPRGHRPDVRAG